MTAPRRSAPTATDGSAHRAAADHRGAGPLRSSGVFIRRSLLHSLRDGEGLIMAIALPVLLMLVFTLIFGGAIKPQGYIDFVVPGVILVCAGFGASSVAVAVNRDFTLGAMRRFRTMPVSVPTVLVGHIVASLIRNLLATAIVIGAAFALGFRPSAGLAGWGAALGLVALWILAITALFAFVGMVASSPETANGYGFALLFLPYLSSAFVPVDTMPVWLRGFAEHQPVGPLVDTIRWALTGAGAPHGLAALAWCLGIIAVSAVLIAWRFPRSADR
ncbi:ABC transporter permease [Leucobacter allii]|uniref:Transport permease protein n=1 Tax=Leucobacter allii TaxID=2932247 RepID=A0ABY4FPI9_9MICO|nr:ABC transporter permease [Leucobacter allii]UOQ58202.1 ABC transporter permease [Leucobacter allii]